MSIVDRARAAAERRMVDACTIRRRTGETTDPNTGVVTPAYTTLYTGKCRIQQHQASADRQDVGEDFQLMLRLEVQLPVVGSEGLKVGDEVTITAAVYDQDLVGPVFRIHDLAHATEKSSRRLECVERTGS